MEIDSYAPFVILHSLAYSATRHERLTNHNAPFHFILLMIFPMLKLKGKNILDRHAPSI